MYRGMRHNLSRNWPSYLKLATDGLNERSLKQIGIQRHTEKYSHHHKSNVLCIGHLKPNDINSPLDNIKVHKAVGLENLNHQPRYFFNPCQNCFQFCFKNTVVSLKKQLQNQERYERNKTKIQANDYVMVGLKEQSFFRGFDVQVYNSHLYQISMMFQMILGIIQRS